MRSAVGLPPFSVRNTILLLYLESLRLEFSVMARIGSIANAMGRRADRTPKNMQYQLNWEAFMQWQS